MELTDVAASGEVQVLTFDLGGETFALEAMVVREVLDLLPETTVPGSGGFAPSLINFRGRVIPVIELGLAFDLEIRPATRATRYVVIECDVGGETTLLGLRADRVQYSVELLVLRLETGQLLAAGLKEEPGLLARRVTRQQEFEVRFSDCEDDAGRKARHDVTLRRPAPAGQFRVRAVGLRADPGSR